MAVEIATAYVGLVPSARGFTAKLSRELGAPLNRAGRDLGDQTGRRITEGVQGRLAGASRILGAAALTGLAGVGVAVGALGGFGLKAAASFQQTRIAFEGILGSAKTADTFLSTLRSFAAKTPFEFPELADSAKNLLAVGFAAQDVIPTMTTLGNVAATLGVGGAEIKGVVRALGQMKGKGKASAEELQQISEQLPGFSAINAIAQDMGVSVPEAFDKMKAGAIPADQAIQAILKGMQKFPGAAGAMQRQSLTLNGVLSTFKDTMRDTLVNAFEPLLPTLSKSLTGITPVLQSSLNKMVGAIAPVLPALLNALGPLLDVIADVVSEVVKGLAPVLPDLGRAFAELAQAVVPLIPPLANLAVILVQEIGVPTIVALAKALGLLATALTPILEQTQILVPVIAALGAGFAITKGVEAFQAGILGIAKVGGTAVGTFQRLAASSSTLLSAIGSGAGSLRTFGLSVLNFGKSALLAAVNIARQTVAFVAQKVAMVAAAVAQKALAAAQVLLNIAMSANPVVLIAAAFVALGAALFLAYKKFRPLRLVVDAIGRAFVGEFNFLRRNWPLVLGILTGPFGLAVLGIKKHWAKITGFVTAAFDFIKTKWPLLLAVLTGPFGLAVLAIAKNWKTITDGVAVAVGAVVGFFTGLPRRILGVLTNVGSVLLGVGRRIVGGLLAGARLALTAYLAFYVRLPLAILGKLKQAGTWLVQTGVKTLLGMLRGIRQGEIAVLRFFATLASRILERLVAASSWLVGVGIRTMAGLLRGIVNGSVLVFNFLRRLPALILGFFVGAARWLVDVGRAILIGLGNGVVSGTGSVLGWLAGLKDRIIGTIGDASRWLFDVGRQIISGLIDGIQSALGGLKDTLGGIGGKIVDWKGPPAKDRVLLAPIGKLLISGLIKGIEAQLSNLRRTLGSVATTIAADIQAPEIKIPAIRAVASQLTLDRATLVGTSKFDAQPAMLTQNFNGPIFGDDHLKTVAKRAAIDGMREHTRHNGFVRGARVG